MKTLNEREIATVLHALRILQEFREGTTSHKNSCREAEEKTTPCAHFDEPGESLSNLEIDYLCEEFSFEFALVCPAHAQGAVVMLQHAINHLLAYIGYDADAVFVLANAIPDVVIEAAENGEIVDPLKGAE